ncbi:Gfo/Idh/MocA family protein [Latilactobacillus fuchuensis]|uniref:Oxidoreductase, NAD-binding Rossmann fold family protein n=1 Tax=Latilactobacillus fuchuensis TaxID=164393 RepID=A0A2N9DX48_9LACO|nr:Gfo/Idh/MocA family oxidoreductase [Latilactobacillus fuchuensis]SPC39250.1 Oxidoreductase, NAD-binding Rossmann fold family protein [Latilactobacillus fuchuensis]
MLKIGVLGLGNIAQKAYLPVMAQMQDRVDWYLCTRQPAKLAQLQAQYHFSHATDSIDDLLTSHLDALFIHTPTPTHYALVRQALENGLHVFIDKPLSEKPFEVAALYQLAKQQNRLLMVGFNRRFAPMIQQLAALPAKHLIEVTKTRVDTLQPTPFAIYDLMVHPLDTALYLAGDIGLDYQVHTYCQQTDHHELLLARIQLETPHQLITVTLDMQSGTNQEIATVQTPTGRYTVNNLTELVHQQATGQQLETVADWVPTLTNRGFAPMIDAFISAIENQQPSPVSTASSRLSHELCQQLIEDAKLR